MRILIYSYNYYPEPIGIAPLMTELAEGLVKRGHQIRVVTSMPNYPERRIYPAYQGRWYMTERRNNVTIQRSTLWIRGPHPGLVDRILLDASFVCTSMIHALKSWKPDLIFATIPPLPIGIPATLVGWLRHCPVVLNVQDILPDAAVHVGLLKNKAMIALFAALEKFAYHHANKISVIADGLAENLLQKGVPPEKIVVIPNWVDVNFIRPLPKKNNPFRAAHQLDDKFVVLYSGNIALTQGLETAVLAAVRLQHLSDIVFAIVGEPTALHELHNFCKKVGAKNVLLLPFQDREALPEMLAAADVSLVMQKRNVISFNMPSKIPVILASARPIVASVPATGTAAAAVKASGGGCVVAPEDPNALAEAILELYKHPERAEALGQQGRRFAVEHYGFELALERYEALFETVVASWVSPAREKTC
ncbi:MAG: glycosyltransferase family 4 protein [Oscillatoriaceae bacterium SKW80]|nr:glycosyltransferase family 4 protein [Oscillatoriaceae bacterium SKYG93]MCX8120844.1 glycosyltransferase family 4 protein [Oscillatoriaceae bacterium SKW80]MDW8454185.1 glycosyltransferase family 4 protein [Oscillatoriaceae cyanobacterium SKYGB_i_bin93]HIK26490.1 glycosyltransferase family 4 protein [Oscillatoriaceae cyanobacterium M7585_C2015_266]